MVESKFQTSFIPKKPLETRSSTRVSRPTGLFRLLAILILLIALAVWGGVYLWKVYLTSKISSAEQSLAASQKEFDLNTVSTLSRLDTRLTAATTLMNNHIATSKLFAELQNITLKTVRFNDFSLTYGPDQSLTLTMKGQAQSYAAVAKQSDIFSQDHNFKSPIFSNLDLDNAGGVIFTVSTGLDPRNFVYGQEVTQ